jgi:hypothetical protein
VTLEEDDLHRHFFEVMTIQNWWTLETIKHDFVQWIALHRITRTVLLGLYGMSTLVTTLIRH